MPLGRAMRVRARFWVLLAVTVLFVVGVRALFVNFERVGIYHRSHCEYRPVGSWTWSSEPREPDPDGWTHTLWPEGSLELTRPDSADPTLEQYRMYDPQGVLRVERVRGSETAVLPARYFDAHGRLVAKGRMRAGARVGIWDVYDVVGRGHTAGSGSPRDGARRPGTGASIRSRAATVRSPPRTRSRPPVRANRV